MKKYECAIYGTMTIEALNENDARQKASEKKTDAWDWRNIEVDEEEESDGMLLVGTHCKECGAYVLVNPGDTVKNCKEHGA
jgi:hypothetical protein